MGSFGQFAKLSALIFVCAQLLLPATLERLSPEQLIEESTEIVRGKVLYCTSTYRPPVIWTLCEIAVSERFKGPAATRVTVAVPGGISSGIRQTYAGAPTLDREKEYMFFLWQGKSGLKQIMGLCQGLLTIVRDDKGNLVAYRARTEERMLDSSGQEVTDTGFSMRLNAMRAKIAEALQ